MRCLDFHRPFFCEIKKTRTLRVTGSTRQSNSHSNLLMQSKKYTEKREMTSRQICCNKPLHYRHCDRHRHICAGYKHDIMLTIKTMSSHTHPVWWSYQAHKIHAELISWLKGKDCADLWSLTSVNIFQVVMILKGTIALKRPLILLLNY